ncbi:porin family protein [Thiotrichales bacterium 19S3-7]|nr:porin family protein [Thiotrichales bacterium 19S3-7]MCF6802069.1 porin family protein [Thiotrichales bacterium 19S3-11]
MKIKLSIIIIVLNFSLLNAYAQSTKVKSGFLVGGQVGYAQVNSDVKNWQAETQKGNFFYGATFGADFALINTLAIGAEAGVFYGNDLAKFDQTGGGTYKVSNLVIPILAKLKLLTPIGLDLFVKGGIAYVHPYGNDTDSSVSIQWDSSWDFAAAAGVGYQYEAFNFFIQYMHIFGNNEVNVNGTQGTGYASDIDAITGGVTYTF